MAGIEIRHFSRDGSPRPEPDPDSYDECSGTLAPDMGPGIIERWYYNKETGKQWFTRTRVFNTIEEAEASIREDENGSVT